MKKKPKRLSIRISDSHNAWLRRAAKKSKQRITDIVEELIEAKFEQRHYK